MIVVALINFKVICYKAMDNQKPVYPSLVYYIFMATKCMGLFVYILSGPRLLSFYKNFLIVIPFAGFSLLEWFQHLASYLLLYFAQLRF